jgi:hypothetical protein
MLQMVEVVLTVLILRRDFVRISIAKCVLKNHMLPIPKASIGIMTIMKKHHA